MKIKDILLQEKFINRYKTLGWNILWTALTMIVAFATDLVPELDLSQSTALLVAFVLAQVSKYLNSKNG
jgi:hypothetical protein